MSREEQRQWKNSIRVRPVKYGSPVPTLSNANARFGYEDSLSVEISQTSVSFARMYTLPPGGSPVKCRGTILINRPLASVSLSARRSPGFLHVAAKTPAGSRVRARNGLSAQWGFPRRPAVTAAAVPHTADIQQPGTSRSTVNERARARTGGTCAPCLSRHYTPVYT